MFRILAFIFVAILFASCGKDKEGFQSTKSGLKYKFIKSSKGVKPALGDVMIMHIAYFTDKDSVLYDSKMVNDSFTVVVVKPTFIGGVEEGFMMMSPGDSALFKVSADSLFEKTFFSELPQYLNPGSSILFSVRMKRIIEKSVNDSIASVTDVNNRRMEFEKIDQFLTQNNMDVMPTQNGAYLSISKPGVGPFPQPGDTIFVAYTGRLIDGTVFDSSINQDPPFSFVLGKRDVIEGWEECIPLMNKGCIARMVIPSDLAYGGDDFGKLPGYSTLIFDVEILEIRDGVEN